MLDEIREYNEYVCDHSETSVYRLKPDIFCIKNHFNGLSRAMFIIARYELAERKYFEDGITVTQQMEIIEQVKQALREWTGLGSSDIETITSYDSWLKRYYKKEIETLDTASNIMAWEEFEHSKKKQYEKKLVLDSSSSKFNSLKEITYEKVIAEAIYFGPLKRYYLVCRKDALTSLTKDDKILNPEKKKNGEQIDNVLRLIAAYLIRKRYSQNTYNIINNADVANWAQCKQIFKDSYYKDMEYDGNPLVDKDNINNSISKCAINNDYMQDFDFQIVEASEFTGVPEGYTFYSDSAIGNRLSCEKTY